MIRVPRFSIYFDPDPPAGVPPTPPTPEVPSAPPAPAPAAAPPAEPAVVPATPPGAPASPASEPTAPQAPEPFDATKLALPAESPLTADDLKGIADEAKTLGLSMAQARTLLEARVTEARAFVAEQARLLGDVKADPQLGGAQFEATLAHVKTGLDWLLEGAPAGEADRVRAEFYQRGLANDKAFIRMIARVGQARAEDRPIGPTGVPRTPLSTPDVLFPSTAVKAS